MTDWSVTVTIQLHSGADDWDAAMEDFLEAQIATPRVLGPVVTLNSGDGTLSALFTVEAADYVSAMRIATGIVPDATERAFGSAPNATIAGTGVALDPDFATV